MSGSHIVAAGDTLSGIAKKYDLSVADLVRWNGLADPDKIRVGQEIELSGHEPAPPVPPVAPVPPAQEVYVVQAGDTVSSIAAKFGKRWVDIGAANQLADLDHIEVGQKLVIPSQGVAR